MAIVDINFQEGEGQDFILEIALGSLAAAEDILSGDLNGAMAHEIPIPATGGNNIFIMSE